MFEMLMARVCAIACGHEDAIDRDRPRCKENLTYQRSVRVQPCIRPLNAAVWSLALMR
jgi:hypothetical protein